MKNISLILVAAILMYSCDKKQVTNTENTAISATDSTNTTSIINPDSEAGLAVAKSEDANMAGKPTLNPEHGQPFHRCDISVGAPIDSAPQQNAAPQAAPQMQSNSNSFIPSANSSPNPAPALPMAPASGPKPAMNPAHGQAHHRCDLAVGAPLI